jgi:hypothetical protein
MLPNAGSEHAQCVEKVTKTNKDNHLELLDMQFFELEVKNEQR